MHIPETLTIDFHTVWSAKLVRSCCTDRDSESRHRIAATWTFVTGSVRPLTICFIMLSVSITYRQCKQEKITSAHLHFISKSTKEKTRAAVQQITKQAVNYLIVNLYRCKVDHQLLAVLLLKQWWLLYMLWLVAGWTIATARFPEWPTSKYDTFNQSKMLLLALSLALVVCSTSLQYFKICTSHQFNTRSVTRSSLWLKSVYEVKLQNISLRW